MIAKYMTTFIMVPSKPSLKLLHPPLPPPPPQPLPYGTTVNEFFPVFQIEGGQEANHITDKDGKLGLYVDTQDNCKVKVTKKTSWWDKFSITSFVSNDRS